MRALRSILMLLLLALPSATRAAALPEAQVKAAFIFNFLLFTNWTADAPPAPLNLCVLGNDAVARELRTLNGRLLGGAPVKVTSVTTPQERNPCHALYLSPAEQTRWPAWLAAPLAQKALTITDSGEKLSQEGCVLAVAVQQDRVVFGLDLAQAERRQLKFSARVLQLAQLAER